MTSKGPCRIVWLCATEDTADICYRHYHNCYMGAGHESDCDSAGGPAHTSANRVGDLMLSVVSAYRAMDRLGWKRR